MGTTARTNLYPPKGFREDPDMGYLRCPHRDLYCCDRCASEEMVGNQLTETERVETIAAYAMSIGATNIVETGLGAGWTANGLARLGFDVTSIEADLRRWVRGDLDAHRFDDGAHCVHDLRVGVGQRDRPRKGPVADQHAEQPRVHRQLGRSELDGFGHRHEPVGTSAGAAVLRRRDVALQEDQVISPWEWLADPSAARVEGEQ